jgi:hypothetical protein
MTHQRAALGGGFGENARSLLIGMVDWNGGRDRDRTCDPLDVNEVLSR